MEHHHNDDAADVNANYGSTRFSRSSLKPDERVKKLNNRADLTGRDYHLSKSNKLDNDNSN